MAKQSETKSHISFHGHRKGGLGPHWILKISAKKVCFLSFEWEKTNFTTFEPTGKFFEKSPGGPPGKNPSDAHVSFLCYRKEPHFW